MVIISLKTFALTGKFGFVEIQMTLSRVMELLGKPSGISHNESSGFDMLHYGGKYEFFFFEQKLIGIQNDHLAFFKQDMALFSNDIFQIEPWFMKRRIERTYKDVIYFLEKSKITYVEKIKHEIVFLYLPSGVSFDFENRSNYEGYYEDGRWKSAVIPKKENYILVGMRYHPRL